MHGIIGPVWMQASTSTNCGLRIAIVEDVVGTPTETYFDVQHYNSVGGLTYIPFMWQISHSGLVALDLRGLCDTGQTVHIHDTVGPSGGPWGWYELERNAT